MSQLTSPEAGSLESSGAAGHELLAKFVGRNRGFQAPVQSSYRQHEQWRRDVLRGLRLLEAQGLLIVLQLVPCQRHAKCGGQPVAAGCQLTPLGARTRGFPVRPVS